VRGGELGQPDQGTMHALRVVSHLGMGRDTTRESLVHHSKHQEVWLVVSEFGGKGTLGASQNHSQYKLER
jgi:hypothetical protein